MAIPLRRALYQTITLWQELLAHLIEGQGAWTVEWACVLCATLEDYVAMPELLSAGKVDGVLGVSSPALASFERVVIPVG